MVLFTFYLYLPPVTVAEVREISSLCVCVGLWNLRCASLQQYRATLRTIDLHVHHGAQGGPTIFRSHFRISHAVGGTFLLTSISLPKVHDNHVFSHGDLNIWAMTLTFTHDLDTSNVHHRKTFGNPTSNRSRDTIFYPVTFCQVWILVKSQTATLTTSCCAPSWSELINTKLHCAQPTTTILWTTILWTLICIFVVNHQNTIKPRETDIQKVMDLCHWALQNEYL